MSNATRNTPKQAASWCATCHRVQTGEPRRREWIVRPDGLGLMCVTCQQRERRGQPLDREATR